MPNPFSVRSSWEESKREAAASGEPARGASNSIVARTNWHRWPGLFLVLCGLLLGGAIAAGTGIVLSNLRDRSLADGERELRNIVFVLAEQTDRAFQAVELVQKSLIERIQSLGVVSGEEFTRQMSSYDVHRMLKDKIAGLPQLDAVVMFNAQGNLVNFSRYWPIPAGNISDRVYFKALQSDAQLISTVSEPVRNRSTGTPAKLSFASQHKSILSRVQMHKEFMKETLSDFLA